MEVSIYALVQNVNKMYFCRYAFREIADDNRVTSEMVVVAATRAESGMYTCAATNEFGYDEATFQLVVQGMFLHFQSQFSNI